MKMNLWTKTKEGGMLKVVGTVHLVTDGKVSSNSAEEHLSQSLLPASLYQG